MRLSGTASCGVPGEGPRLTRFGCRQFGRYHAPLLLPTRPSGDSDPLSVNRRRRPGAAAVGRGPQLKEHSDRHAALDRQLESPRRDVLPDRESHRLDERRRHDAVVGETGVRPLMVLLDEAAPGDLARAGPLELGQQPEEIQPPAAEAEIVVLDYFSRNALIRTSYCWASRAYTP